MDSILRKSKSIIASAVKEAFPDVDCPPIMILPASVKIEVEADYSCTIAMSLVKLLAKMKQNLTGMQIAENIKEKLQESSPAKGIFENLTVTKPGFINFVVNKDYVNTHLFSVLKAGQVQVEKDPRVDDGPVIVDYSAPNIAKEMHVGHLRSTIIGDCAARMLEYAGFKLLRLNHVGDWGTQFGMLLALLFERFGEDHSKFTNEISDLQTFYKEAKKRFDEDEEFKSRSYATVVQLQSKDPVAIAAWQRICDVSRREFSTIYERLGIENLIERGESFYHEGMKKIVEVLKENNWLEEDEGRQILWPNVPKQKNDIPLTIIKSDGGFTYDTSDLAALHQRVFEEKAARIIYVVDNGQAVHFQTLFAAGRRTILAGQNVKLDFVGFGLVLGEDRKKFRTRSGDTIKLSDLLDEGLQRSKAKLIEKNRQAELTEEELKAAQEAVAYGCIKYADLSRDRNKDYVFSFDQMLDDKGNTAVYLLYSLTRIRSIRRNAGFTEINEVITAKQEATGTDTLDLTHPLELKLAKFVLKFPDIIQQCIDDLQFHLLCNYLYDLSGVFTDFYGACYCIEKSGDQLIKLHYDRILLCEATALVMDKGLTLLGLKTLSRM